MRALLCMGFSHFLKEYTYVHVYVCKRTTGCRGQRRMTRFETVAVLKLSEHQRFSRRGEKKRSAKREVGVAEGGVSVEIYKYSG